ncbi:MAG: calcium-binding protein, partial [Selenomonadaceae bacterium]|nr:calcium-binding protein [Selenomonadaceae bacterium]
TISSKSTSTSISTADGNDLISLQASYKNTVSGGKGSDTINLDMNSTEILIQYNLGDGDDVIEGFNVTSTLRIGNGDNTYSKSVSGNDVIVTAEDGGKITLKGAATLATVNIDGVTKIDTINTDNDVAITGMRLADSIANRGSNVTISTFAGKDTVHNYGRFVTIDAGADVDYISSNNANNSSISTGDGNDVIDNAGGYQNTILAGKGDDDIYMSSSEQVLIQYNSGDGKDYITDFNSTSTLQIGNGTGSYYKEVKDDDVIITVDKDKITLKGAATLSVLNIAGEEEIEGKNVRNKDDYSIVSGTGGDDSIRNTGANVELNALGGNDSIRNSGNNVTIDGGAKNDSITNETDNVTIIGGLGNDQIYNDEGKNILFAYNAGDGNDVITGFNETSTLSISGGLYSLQTSGNDVIVSVDDGKITLKGAASLSTVNVIGVEDKPASRINNSTDNATVTGGNADDTVYNTGSRAMIVGYGGNDSLKSINKNYVTIDGGAGNDRIINTLSEGKWGGSTGIRASLNGGEGNDYISNGIGNSATLIGGDGDDTLTDRAFYSRFIGGKGNDLIRLYKTRQGNDEVVLYNTGDGNDYVTGF